MNDHILTSQMLKEFADKLSAGGGGNGILGVAPIERFNEAPERMHPKNIFPDCKSVISIVQPIPRSTYRGITSGTYWPNYTYYSYNRLNTLFRPMVTYEVARFIEDHGFEAVPVYPGVPEVYPDNPEPVAPGRPVPEININVRIAAVACGLGEIGWSKVFIHKVFGPRVRIGTILTDAVLEPDALVEPGTLCNRCMACVRECPGGCIPADKTKSITVNVAGKECTWGDIDVWRCNTFYTAGGKAYNPFVPAHVFDENADFLESKVEMTPENEVAAARAFEMYAPSWVGYAMAKCGGCIRGCESVLEKVGCLEGKFKEPLRTGKPWKMDR